MRTCCRYLVLSLEMISFHCSSVDPPKMSEQIEEKIKNYRTAPFDARFPNTNQTRNCFQNYLGKEQQPASLTYLATMFLITVDIKFSLLLSS